MTQTSPSPETSPHTAPHRASPAEERQRLTELGFYRIELECTSAGVWFATSPDLEGLCVNGHSLSEISTLIPNAIRELEAVKTEQQNKGGPAA